MRARFTVRRARSKRGAIAMLVAMALTPAGNPIFVPGVQAQQQVAPVSQGLTIDAQDLRFIFQQILVAQDHAAGGTLLGPGPNQVSNPQLPRGLRTVDGSFNNLVPGQSNFGRADLVFPRMTTPVFKPAENGTSYAQKSGNVIDSQPRVISNLIVDQTATNPAALAAAANPCGSGGFVCSGSSDPDPDTGTLFIPNITPDFGLSAPFNLMFAFFGQFFDHGLDLVTKGGGAVVMPLKADDPLFVPNGNRNFMVMTRGQNQPGPDGILGTSDDIQEAMNTTTPFVDQNQTYTSHPSHQVFLRDYELNAQGRPTQTGKMIDGGSCAQRPTGIAGDLICAVGNWSEVKAQASAKLGIQLTDMDIFDVPLLLTDPYGHFKPGANGFPQLILPGSGLLEGDPAANGGAGVTIPANAFRTAHAFLNDIAHNAAPGPGLVPDADTTISVFGVTVQPPGTYDNELLDRHFITGDGRGNENIALSMVHQIFHSEHNRLRYDIDRQINALLTPQEIAAWHAVHGGSGWDYGERLFQAARFVTEMEYQHLVFEEFARTIQPLINPFTTYDTSLNPAIVAEFAHTGYRLGHSMLPEVLGRTNADGTTNDIRLLNAFLNPVEYTNGGTAGVLTADKAAGALVRGLSKQIGNELDEFVSSSVRDTLVGLPLDLPAINIARTRSEGVPSLNVARRQFFAATQDTAVKPYDTWFEFGLNLKHSQSLVNFIAAYGKHASITSATTVAAKRSAAQILVNSGDAFLFSSDPVATGLDDVDFWVGGLAERQAVFGGLLGSTFNFVFENQLENLQDGDRFYYLQRTDGLNLRTQLEGNSFAELIRRNTDFQGGMDVIFNTADFTFDAANLTGTAPIDLGSNMSLLTLPDGTKVFFDPLHTGKNIVFNGGPGDDRFQADIGDDTLYGNDGNDRLDGFEGNDTIHGGNGDDILFGGNGDDVLKGGNGNDALSSGPGFGGDLNMAGDGNDFIVNGPDTTEVFAGSGNDVIVDGNAATEGLVGNAGDDWIEGNGGHDANMFGDNPNFFDLLAGLSTVGGDDVFDGGGGQDNYFGEGGNDIAIQSEGTDVFLGLSGFDWITQRANPVPGDIELELSPFLAGLNLNDTRDKYLFVDGASGWDLNDHIRGDNNVVDAAAPIERRLTADMALTAAGAAKVTGLTAFMTDFGQTLPFIGGNILLGGTGSDLIEGKAGNDLIDGDVSLNMQLRATLNDGTQKLVNSASALSADVFSSPQRLNPGNIEIVRSLVTPAVPAADCGAATPLNCDIAVFRGNRVEYRITPNANGTVTVVHITPLGGVLLNDGTDTLRNIERLQFVDVTTLANGDPTQVSVPSVVGATLADATATITVSVLNVGTVTNANSTTVPAGVVISQSPLAGTSVSARSAVSLVVSLGALVPNVVDATQAAATAAINAAGLIVSTVTTSTSTTVAAGSVISQNPAGNTNAAPGSAVSLVVSIGQANVVPNVVGLSRAAATTSITSVGLTVGVVRFANSTTIPAGSVVSTTPIAGTALTAGSAVAMVVSLGADGLVLALGFDEATGATAIDSAPVGTTGAIRQATRVAGQFGRALNFDGIDDWVTILDTTSSPLDLTNGMTIEAWVNPSALTDSRTIMMKERGTGLSYMLYANDDVAPTAPTGNIHVAGVVQEVRPVPAAALALNVWTHVATTYDGANQRLYVNGVLVGSRAQTGNIAVSNSPLRIGGNNVFGGEFFNGRIDEVRVYNRARTAAQITADMSTPIVR